MTYIQTDLTLVENRISQSRINSLLHAFEISTLKTESIHNMLDGVRDVFNDAAGIISGGVGDGSLVIGECLTSDALQYSNDAAIVQEGIGWVVAKTYTVVGNLRGSLRLKYDYRGINVDIGPQAKIVVNGVDVPGTLHSFNNNSYLTYVHDMNVYLSDGDTIQIYHYADADTHVYTANFRLYYDETSHIESVMAVAESQPTNIHAVILADDAAITLNTDLKFYASVDDGATWEQITLEDSGDYSATEKILTGSVAVTGTGTTIKYQIECTDVDFEFYAVGLLWD